MNIRGFVIRLDVRPVGVPLKIQLDIQEVDRLKVGFYSDGKVIGLKYLTDAFLGVFCVPGVEV